MLKDLGFVLLTNVQRRIYLKWYLVLMNTMPNFKNVVRMQQNAKTRPIKRRCLATLKGVVPRKIGLFRFRPVQETVQPH